MFLSLLYDFVLLIVGLAGLPWRIWEICAHKKYRKSYQERFGKGVPDLDPNRPVIWMHAISVGETRAIIPLYRDLKQKYPKAQFLISSITETGHTEALRSLKGADGYIYLPIDFSFIIRPLVKKIHPDILILAEGDFWFNLINQVKKQGAPVCVINGKISEKSTSRFEKVPFFAKRLFSPIDCFCVQSEEFAERFKRLGVDPQKITVTGNIKLDASPQVLSPEEIQIWKNEMGISDTDRVIVLGSTHHPEEEDLLNALKPVWDEIPELKVLLVPRHPERFPTVEKLLSDKGFSAISYSKRANKTGEERIVLIDAMGILNYCFQLSELALIAGSYTDRVGGHNIFEPIPYGVPVIFGPHMKNQEALVDLVLHSEAGRQVPIEEVRDFVREFLKSPEMRQKMQKNASKLVHQVRGTVERTLHALNPFLPKP